MVAIIEGEFHRPGQALGQVKEPSHALGLILNNKSAAGNDTRAVLHHHWSLVAKGATQEP